MMHFSFLKPRWTIVSGILCAVAISPAARGESDLWEIYQLALINDPSYQAALSDHEAKLYNLPLAESAFKPVVEAGADLGGDYNDRTGSSEFEDDQAASIVAELPLYDKFSSIAIDQEVNLEDISTLRLQREKQLLALRVADRYFNLLAGRDALEVAQLNKISIKRQMDLASERLAVGLGTRSDLYDAQARFALAESDEILAQNKINNDIALLKQIIGSTPEALVPLSDTAPIEPPSPNDLDSWITDSLENNLEIKIQSLNKDIALQEIDKQKSTRYSPQLSIDGGYRIANNGSELNGVSGSYNSASVALRLRIPLYLAGTTKLRTEQAGYLYNSSESFLEEARRLASTEATSAFLDITSGVPRVEALYEAILAGESALEAKEEGFNAGLTTNIDVLDAQRDLSQSRTEYLRAKYTYILSILELERAVGGLNDEDILRINSWLRN